MAAGACRYRPAAGIGAGGAVCDAGAGRRREVARRGPHQQFTGPELDDLAYQVAGDAPLAAVGLSRLLIALRPWWPRVSAVGSAFGVLLFHSTLSFLFTTPGVSMASAGGFPAPSVLPGQFLLKDLVLLGAALWTLGDSLGAARSQARSARKVSVTAARPGASGAAGDEQG